MGGAMGGATTADAGGSAGADAGGSAGADAGADAGCSAGADAGGSTDTSPRTEVDLVSGISLEWGESCKIDDVFTRIVPFAFGLCFFFLVSRFLFRFSCRAANSLRKSTDWSNALPKTCISFLTSFVATLLS